MAEQRFTYLVIGHLRKLKRFYSALRWIYRRVSKLPSQILRHAPAFTKCYGPPSGFFSGLEFIHRKYEGAVIVPSQSCEPYGERTLVHLSGLEQDKNQPWPIFWLYIPSARLIGEGLALVDDENRLMAESTFSQSGDVTDSAYWHVRLSKPQAIKGHATSLISRWGNSGYWHWLMDSLPRLALLPKFPDDTQILVPPLRPWMRWFIVRLNLAARCIETSAKHVTIEHYFFSSPTSMTGCHNPYAIRFLRDNFLGFASSKNNFPRKFYIIREGFTRGIQNENEVRSFFINKGWGLIAPETLSIEDQIRLFANAEAIAGIHGSAFTNLLWCSPGCEVIEFAPNNFLAGAFEILAKNLGLRHQFIICEADNHHQVRVDLNLLVSMVD